MNTFAKIVTRFTGTAMSSRARTTLGDMENTDVKPVNLRQRSDHSKRFGNVITMMTHRKNKEAKPLGLMEIEMILNEVCGNCAYLGRTIGTYEEFFKYKVILKSAYSAHYTRLEIKRHFYRIMFPLYIRMIKVTLINDYDDQFSVHLDFKIDKSNLIRYTNTI